ncbi:hypothetical protein GE09DRAFT_707263 [Coniochaeta sp. 2T2.1]|nr:hypothetical protein GE09DRAFT_107729 [Coniochaeta sp. 2T2.1]KAB5570423.1 hypothetical protein GE09DRAFT_707263 [Coniochaeta sp. 2T2.1]
MDPIIRTIRQTDGDMAAKPRPNVELARKYTDRTMSLYRRAREPSSEPKTGNYCIPVRPETRLTDSPTGGVVGRYLTQASDHSSPPSLYHSSSNRTSLDSHDRLSMDMGNGYRPVAVQQQFPGGQQSAVGKQAASPKTVVPAVNRFFKEPASHDGFSVLAGQAPMVRETSAAPNTVTDNSTSGGSLALPPPAQSPQNKSLSPEDMRFLMENLNKHVHDAEEEKLMQQLVPVHGGRPGQHILHIHRKSGQLYVCIPPNPYKPEPSTSQQGYHLQSYEDVIEGNCAKKPYPAPDGSSLATCNHCNKPPTSFLNNDVLCPFHAYYLVTGRFLPYYQFCALVEMEYDGYSLMEGWWTLDDMVKFVDDLTVGIGRCCLFNGSEGMKGCWVPKVSPFGPIGKPVPDSASRKTAWDSSYNTVRPSWRVRLSRGNSISSGSPKWCPRL